MKKVKKKDYQKPTVEVDEPVLRTALLEISGGYAERKGYESGGTQDWDEESKSNQSHIWDDEEK